MKRRLYCNDWFEDKQNMWMCLADGNAFCIVNKKTNEASIIGSYSENNIADAMLSHSVESVGTNLVFSPFFANDIAILDMENKKLEFIPIKKIAYDSADDYGKFFQMFIYEEKVFMMGFTYPAIIRLDLVSKEIIYLTDWVHKINLSKDVERIPFYIGSGFGNIGEDYYFPLCSSSGLLRLNPKNLETEYIPINSDFKGFLSLGQYQNELFLTGYVGNENSFLIWDIKKKESRIIPIAEYGRYLQPILYNHGLYFFPSAGTKILRYDCDNKICSVFRDLKDILRGNQFISIVSIKQMQDCVHFYSGEEYVWYKLNLDTNQIEKREIFLEDDNFLHQWASSYIQQSLHRGSPILEKNIPISEYFRYLEGEKCKVVVSDIKNGKKIWSRVRGSL